MKIMSWKLWITNRSFPQVPLVPLNSSLQLLLFVLFFVFSVLILIKPVNIFFLSSLLTIEIISMLGDQLRWHPWEYQFLFICFAVVLSKKNPQRAINSIIFIFASSYFFSGISKVNSSFLNDIWLRLMVVKALHFPHKVYYNSVIKYAGLAIPLIEIVCGILLLLPKRYKVTAWLPIGVHLFILLYFSPLGLSYDYIVFPWNVAMMIIVYLLFINNKTIFSFQDIFYKRNSIIIYAWILLPIAGIFGYWPPFFSFKLYSGKPLSMIIYILDTTNIPSEIKPYVRYSKKGHQDLHFYFRPFIWCNDELNVPIPPERRIYESLQASFEEKYRTMKFVFVYY